MGTTSSIKINTELLAQLNEYRKLTGVSVTHSVGEALTDFIEIVIPARLEALKALKVSQSEKRATKKK